ncbi:DUF2178 domain-containing protein [Thermococcus sp. 21S9]|uniref:DUF2178 domain-containing protein n=1 Tax=Thermococcus sp. 21S9 TaxID=1638223 RepID=UPI001F0F1E57|nr:DUF2178 domain-containing protein [Thermococcus sp. 21S9]
MGELRNVPVLIVGVLTGMGIFYSTHSGRSEIGLVIFAFALIFANWYSSWLRERGVILQDERTIRINEVASRRTLQVTVIALGVSVLILSQGTSNPEIKGAFESLSAVLAGISLLHLALRHYYSRVM